MMKLSAFMLSLSSILSPLLADFTGSPVDIFSGVDPKEISVADIDNDGSKDVIFVDNGTIKILYQDGAAANTKSIKFNGNQTIQVNSNDSFNVADFSVSFWVKFEVLPASQTRHTFFSKSATGKEQYKMSYNGTYQRIEFHVYEQGFGWIECKASQGALIAGQWHHIVGIHSVSTAKMSLWIDGTMASSNRASLSYVTNNLSLKIGSAEDVSFPNFLNAQIDEFAFYTTGLSQADISLLFNKIQGGNLNKLPSSSKLALWLTMGDHASDSSYIAQDSSKNGLSAYLINFIDSDYLQDTP